jgi:hypothetical protein
MTGCVYPITHAEGNYIRPSTFTVTYVPVLISQMPRGLPTIVSIAKFKTALAFAIPLPHVIIHPPTPSPNLQRSLGHTMVPTYGS